MLGRSVYVMGGGWGERKVEWGGGRRGANGGVGWGAKGAGGW